MQEMCKPGDIPLMKQDVRVINEVSPDANFAIADEVLLPCSMVEEEVKLQMEREKEESDKAKTDGPGVPLNATHFSKLEELLTKTQLYTEFLFENMEGITCVMLSRLYIANFSRRFFSPNFKFSIDLLLDKCVFMVQFCLAE